MAGLYSQAEWQKVIFLTVVGEGNGGASNDRKGRSGGSTIALQPPATDGSMKGRSKSSVTSVCPKYYDSDFQCIWCELARINDQGINDDEEV
jgi:hypothetical protein